MTKSWMAAMLALPLLWAAPDAGVPAGFEYCSNASIDQAVQKLDAKAATDPHRVGTQQLADYPNDAVLLAHREGDGQAEWHETQVDVVFVRSGSATLVVGDVYKRQASRRGVHTEEKQVFAVVTQTHLVKFRETPHKQARGRQQYQRHGHLCNHQRLAHR